MKGLNCIKCLLTREVGSFVGDGVTGLSVGVGVGLLDGCNKKH